VHRLFAAGHHSCSTKELKTDALSHDRGCEQESGATVVALSGRASLWKLSAGSPRGGRSFQPKQRPLLHSGVHSGTFALYAYDVIGVELGGALKK